MASVWTRRGVITGAVLAFALVGLAGGGPAAGDTIAVGEGAFEFAPDAGRPQHKLKVWTCRPAGFGPDSPLVLVMHGVKRDGKGYRDAWTPHSWAGGFLLVVPEFPQADYPEEAYQLGNLRDRAGKPLPAEQWTFAAIERLFDHVTGLTGSRAEKYYLYGHAAGGQFVHRFVLFMAQACYAWAIAANPGYYTFPTQDAAYLYGLTGTPGAGQLAPATFGRDFVLLLGAEDTNRDDPDLRKTPQTDAQGLTRFERGQNYFRAATAAARAAQAPFHWRQVTVPGVGHSNAKMAPAAARELFARRE